MALDLQTLLEPVPGDDPAGPDLSYDPERHQIEQVFEVQASLDTLDGDEGPEIDWRDIVRMIGAQSERTKDVWLAVYLCRAGARWGSLETVELGAQYLAGLFEQYWEVVHPKLEEDGFQGRKGPCDSLTAGSQFLNPLRRTVLLEHPRFGRFTGADFERFRLGAESEDGYGPFRAALDAIGDEGLREAVGRIDNIEDGLRRADAVLTANAEGSTGTNFRPTYDVLAEIRRSVQSFASTPAEDEEAQHQDEFSDDPGAAAPQSGARLSGRVDSREDVIRALDAISDYYARREPTSPVPLVLQRARKWVHLDFLSVLQDIAPDSIEEARRILTSRAEAPPADDQWG